MKDKRKSPWLLFGVVVLVSGALCIVASLTGQTSPLFSPTWTAIIGCGGTLQGAYLIRKYW